MSNRSPRVTYRANSICVEEKTGCVSRCCRSPPFFHIIENVSEIAVGGGHSSTTSQAADTIACAPCGSVPPKRSYTCIDIIIKTIGFNNSVGSDTLNENTALSPIPSSPADAHASKGDNLFSPMQSLRFMRPSFGRVETGLTSFCRMPVSYSYKVR